MKVVLFCGGFGMRLREHSEAVPKPLVQIGYRPILWHVMKYYAHYGHKDFILCLGWKANEIKEYFLSYNECLSNDFVLSGGGDSISLLHTDIHDWNITFVDTGIRANIGERLKAVEPHLANEGTFLANYTDGLTDLHLPSLIDFHHQRGVFASFLSVKPSHSFHVVSADDVGHVREISEIHEKDVWMNAGFFVFDQKIFRYLGEGEELIEEPFQRLIAKNQLCSLRFSGYFGCMDTYKERQELEDMYAQGVAPWEVWKDDHRALLPEEHVQDSIGAVRTPK